MSAPGRSPRADGAPGADPIEALFDRLRDTKTSRRGLLRGGAGLGAALAALGPSDVLAATEPGADLIVRNARIATLDPRRPDAEALAVRDGAFLAVGTEADAMAHAAVRTQIVDAGGRRIVPGLVDSHIHLIRGGLHYNAELRWDGVPSLADALRLLREQAIRTPPPQWVRVVGGWSEFQFAERRMPTLDEINAAAPDTPVLVLHLYSRALLNRAALRAAGFTRDTPDPPGGLIERDASGDPTGLLLAKPSGALLSIALTKAPPLAFEDQINSTRHFMRELNQLGITSVIDAAGGGHVYPHAYAVIEEVDRRGQLTVRIAYDIAAQGREPEEVEYARYAAVVTPGSGSERLRLNGAGENLSLSAYDFENFLEPRPEAAATARDDVARVARTLVENRWPFRVHATYDETIGILLDAFERVDRDVPFAGLRWTIDHAETVSAHNIDRIAALGGGIAVQNRMAFQGEHFVARYGADAAAAAPPVGRMLRAGVPVGAGTDATRAASYNPWVCLQWLVTGKTVGGLQLAAPENRLDRTTALRLWTGGSAWLSGDAEVKGEIPPGLLADFAVLSRDYLTVPEEEIGRTEAVLTVLGGEPVHGADDFAALAPPLPRASPDWSPVNLARGGMPEEQPYALAAAAGCGCSTACGVHGHAHVWSADVPSADRRAFWGALGCSCWAL